MGWADAAAPTGFSATKIKVQLIVTGKLALRVPGAACVMLVTKLPSKPESEAQPLAFVTVPEVM